MLTDCINDPLLKGLFPDILKLGNTAPVYKKDEPTDKGNYRLVSVLPQFLKIFARLIYDQLNKYLEQYLNSVLRGFTKALSTHYALFLSTQYALGFYKNNKMNYIGQALLGPH